MGFDASRLAGSTETRFFDAARGPAPILNAVMIGNFPPRKCGIASYTRDSLASLCKRLPGARWSVVAMDDGKEEYAFPETVTPEAVTHVIPQEDEAAYVRVADELNRSGAEVAFIQHEFGMFGGVAGSHLLRLMRRLRIPQIVTLHTVLEKPDPAQKSVMDEILRLASAAIVLSDTAADILARVHSVGPSKVHVIARSAPERSFAGLGAETADLAVSCREEHRRRQDQAFRALARPGYFALTRMADGCGILQRARHSAPDRPRGYSTDDNARALTLATRLTAEGENGEITRLATVTSAFVNQAWNPRTGRFRNFLDLDHKWQDEEGSDDCCARALESLCVTARHAVSLGQRQSAADFVRQIASHIPEWSSLRARALVVKALVEGGAETLGEGHSRSLISQNAAALMDALATRLSRGHRWFEPSLSSEEARLPEALILAGQHLGDSEVKSAGLTALDVLIQRQTAAHGGFSPIGRRSFDGSSATLPSLDQKPGEALATIDACLAGWRAANHARYAQAARNAFLWFGGRNDHDLPLANPADGSCHDGLTVDGVNDDQSAESILAYQLAAAAIREYLRRRPM